MQIFYVHPDTCDFDIDGNAVQRKSDTSTSSLQLYVSRDGNTFAEVCMPTQLSDEAYTMVSTQDGRGAFMIADHHNKDAAISNMCDRSSLLHYDTGARCAANVALLCTCSQYLQRNRWGGQALP
jgi:hypothetical protein